MTARPKTDAQLLATKQGRAVLGRCLESTTEFYKHRESHARQVALVVLRAKGAG